jgi:hypothetical protein
VRQAASPLPGVSSSSILVPSEDEIYVFDSKGRHMQTLDAMTYAVSYQFGYTGSGLLDTITDGDGNVTRIERLPDGTPTAIIAPFGQRTGIGVDADGYLSSVSDPENRAITRTQMGMKAP